MFEEGTANERTVRFVRGENFDLKNKSQPRLN